MLKLGIRNRKFIWALAAVLALVMFLSMTGTSSAADLNLCEGHRLVLPPCRPVYELLGGGNF